MKRTWIQFCAVVLFGMALTLSPVAIVGCKAPTAQARAYKTLAAVGHSTDAAIKAYFDLVVAGKVKTNGVPVVALSYAEFQTIYATAVTIAAKGSNTVASTEILAAAAKVVTDIERAKR